MFEIQEDDLSGDDSLQPCFNRSAGVTASGRCHLIPQDFDDKAGRVRPGARSPARNVATYLNGGSWTLLGEFVEVESGRKSDRPQLMAALAQCRVNGRGTGRGERLSPHPIA